jgi:ankyrin repeat protein
MIVKELNELRDCANDASDSTAAEASFQIALCYMAGYGVEPNADAAVEIMRENAEGGHLKSQLAILPAVASLSLEVRPDDLEGFITSQARGGSFLAVSILAALYPEKSHSLPYKWPSSDDSQREALFLASHVGDLEFLKQATEDGTILTARGHYGESSLHRAALCPEVEALRTIISLPGADALIHACSNTSVKLFDDHSNIEYIPKNSTAFEWAVAVDNSIAVETFINQFGEDCITFNSLKQACMCLSFCSLKLMIEKLQGLRKWEDTLKRDRSDCTLLHWAIRPDYFRHLLSWNFNSYGARKCSLLRRQMNTIRVLIDAGCSWEAHVKGLFTPVHMLAAYGQPDALNSFLSFASERKSGLIDIKSKYGWRPIRDAMVRGRKACFKTLLEHNAVLWAVDGQHHAAHVCAICEEDLAVVFAQEIVKRDEKCHKAEGNYGGHPLHYAAQSGMEELIRFWVNHNSDLLAPNNDLFTPIGLAVQSRSVRGARALQHEHVRRRLPIRGTSSSWAKSMFPNESILFGKSYTALAMLLAPGYASPKETRDRLALPALDAGCNDLDWSFASRVIFKDLLDGYNEPSTFNKHFVDNIFASSQANSGIEHAIGYGNLPAFEELIKSDHFTYDHRSLLQIAVEELRYEEGLHPSPLQDRRRIFNALLIAQEEHFESEKRRRCRPPSNLP